MALVEESQAERDFGDRRIRVGQLARGALDSQTADIVPDRAPIVGSKRSRKMGRIHAHRFGN